MNPIYVALLVLVILVILYILFIKGVFQDVVQFDLLPRELWDFNKGKGLTIDRGPKLVGQNYWFWTREEEMPIRYPAKRVIELNRRFSQFSELGKRIFMYVPKHMHNDILDKIMHSEDSEQIDKFQRINDILARELKDQQDKNNEFTKIDSRPLKTAKDLTNIFTPKEDNKRKGGED